MTVTAQHPEPDPWEREVLHLDSHQPPVPHDLDPRILIDSRLNLS